MTSNRNDLVFTLVLGRTKFGGSDFRNFGMFKGGFVPTLINIYIYIHEIIRNFHDIEPPNQFLKYYLLLPISKLEDCAFDEYENLNSFFVKTDKWAKIG